MPTPRCHFYPKETARRQCPGVTAPVSARACHDKFLCEVDCPESCPFLAANFEEQNNRILRKGFVRLREDFAVMPEWTSEVPVLIGFLLIEFTLARYAQWYPAISDAEALGALDAFETHYRALGLRLEHKQDYASGWAVDMTDYLALRLGVLIDDKKTDPGERKVALTYALAALARIRECAARHKAKGDRGYLDFLVRFADPAPPRPAKASGILLPN